jgi:uncharacterized membrane protein
METARGPDLEEILAEERRDRSHRPVRAWLHLLAPLGVLAAAVLALALAGSLATVAKAAVVALFTVGKLIILSGAAPGIWGMTAYELAVMVFCLDLWTGRLFAFNLHFIHRVPRMGPWLVRLQDYCRYWLAMQPWMAKAAFLGVALFVMFPLTGTGAPGGSILARICGLRPGTTLLAVACGAALGCGLMAAFAQPLEPVFHDLQHEWWFKALGLLLLGILVLFLVLLGRKLSRAADALAARRNMGGSA